MQNKISFFESNYKIAICGKHIKEDAIHVGLYWNFDDKKRIFHFLNGNKIPVQEADSSYFNEYFFNQIDNFPEFLLPSLIAITELISENKINNLIFNRDGVVYNGGKFEFNCGDFIVTPIEKIMNCGVFIVALLNTFDFKLINWNSWPNQIKTDYLNEWLSFNNIPQKDWDLFYSQTKIIRGKHILVSPSTISKPSNFDDADFLAYKLIEKLTT